MRKLYEPEHPLDSLHNIVVCDSRDWSLRHRDAWLYGIICGWDDEAGDAEPDEDAMTCVAGKHGWKKDDIARLRRLRKRYRQLEKLEPEEIDRLRNEQATIREDR